MVRLILYLGSEGALMDLYGSEGAALVDGELWYCDPTHTTHGRIQASQLMDCVDIQ